MKALAVAAAATVVLAALAAAADVAAPPSNVMAWGEVFANGTLMQLVYEPVPLPGSVPFVEAAGGQQFACMRIADGSAYCVGDNKRGQLGVGEDVEQSGVPLPVAGGKRYHSVLVAAWASYACGLLDAPGTPQDRTLECWCAGAASRCERWRQLLCMSGQPSCPSCGPCLLVQGCLGCRSLLQGPEQVGVES